MSKNRPTVIHVFPGSQLFIFAQIIVEWVFFIALFHLNYTIWQSFIVDILIVIMGFGAVLTVFKTKKMTVNEAKIYFSEAE